MTATLTPARRRALEVMAAIHPRPARVSNVTAGPVRGERASALVYWQSVDWLRSQGLVTGPGVELTLTAAGLAACAENGIEVRR
jgi:hypothetical protein